MPSFPFFDFVVARLHSGLPFDIVDGAESLRTDGSTAPSIFVYGHSYRMDCRMKYVFDRLSTAGRPNAPSIRHVIRLAIMTVTALSPAIVGAFVTAQNDAPTADNPGHLPWLVEALEDDRSSVV